MILYSVAGLTSKQFYFFKIILFLIRNDVAFSFTLSDLFYLVFIFMILFQYCFCCAGAEL